jgi:hypothetical protein
VLARVVLASTIVIFASIYNRNSEEDPLVLSSGTPRINSVAPCTAPPNWCRGPTSIGRRSHLEVLARVVLASTIVIFASIPLIRSLSACVEKG